MKTTLKALLVGIVAASYCSIGSAQIIYSNAFNGGAVNINGTAPSLANAFAGGSSSATWNSVIGVNDANAALANGTVDASRNSVLLPFTPQSGYLYTLSATITWTADPGSWISLGFTGGNPVNQATTTRFADNPVNGYDWLIARPTSANEQWFAGPRTTPAVGLDSENSVSGLGTYTLQLDLNTMGSQWVISAFVDGIQMGTNATLASNPAIVAVGYGQNAVTSGSGIQWDNLVLSATSTPEPSTLALTGLGLAGVYMFRRQRK